MEMAYFARFRARPGGESAVAATILEVVPLTRQEPGCLGVRAFRSVRDPSTFFIHSHWRDAAAFERHVSLPHTVSFVERIEGLIDHAFDGHRAERIG